MDPNGDGFVSKLTSGFSNDGYNVDEFELNMFSLPKLGGDATGDNIGASCGITDLIPDSKGASVYAVRDANDNLIFRFRVGDDNPSVEAWTILLDTDGKIGAADPNATAGNPGFEIDITLIKRNNSGVLVYNIDGNDNCPSPLLFYGIDTYFQISIADEVSCGDPDYFYDFYVPFSEIASTLGINLATGLRFVAVTNVSATCAMGGTIADISGVDNNDPEYSGCESCAFEDLINNQCPTAIADLCETCEGFEKDKVSPPVIDVPIRAGQTTLTGSVVEANIFLRLQVYTNIAPEGSPPAWGPTPRVEVAVYAVGNLWTVTLASPLLDFDKIVAIAQKDEFTVPCGADGNNSSSTSVTVVAPNTEPVALDQNLNVAEDNILAIALTATDAENDPLTFSIVTLPAHGTLTGTPPNVSYTPALNYFGADSFTFQANDGIFSSIAAGTITITVTPVNDKPIANNLNVSTAEDTPVATNVTASDVEGDALTYTVVAVPLHGTLSGTLPNLTYTPSPNYFGQDTYTFKVNDGLEDSNVATVSINITPVADAPAADPQNITTAEDTPVAIALTGTDPDLDALTFAVVTGPTNGTLSGTGANVTYTPNANYFGPDSFTFRVNDGGLNSAPATISITVTPVDDNPVANNQSVTTNEDTPIAFALSVTNVDNDPLTYTIIAPPTHGLLTGTAPNLTYTPDPNYNGQDSFTFKVNNGSVDSNTATVSITVNPVGGDAPSANDQSVTTPEDTPVAINLTGSDPDLDALTFVVVTSPVNGTLSGAGPNLTYTPNANYSGSDSFTFRVNDGTLNSSPATINITVTPVDDNPVANSQSLTTAEDTPIAFVLSVTNVDNDPLTYSIISGPSNGSLSGTAPNLTYTPGADYNGQDSFTFRVNNGSVDSNTATVSITVTPVGGDAPVATPLSVTTPEDTQVAITLTGTDADLDPLTFTVLTNPANGTLSGTVPDLTYTPSVNFTGADSFTFHVNDGTTNSAPATVSITVTPINDAPVAVSQSVTYDLNTPEAITLTGSDPDGDAITFIITVQPLNGVLSGSGANVTYTPNSGFTGSDFFKFIVNDGSLNSAEATISLNLTPVSNVAPVANDQTVSTNEDVAKIVVLFAADENGDNLTYTITQNPANGVLNVSGTNVTYTPNANFNGPDSFKFEADDGSLTSNEATVTITVNPINDAPIANAQNVTTTEDTPKIITLTGSDVEGSALTYQIVSSPAHGTLDVAGSSITYTPSINYTGSDAFTFRVNDGTTNSGNATVAITVTPINDAPTASDQNLTTNEDIPLAITLTAADVENSLTYAITQPPTNGTLNVSGANVTYTPNANFNGSDSFKFKANDGTIDSNEGTIAITVTPVNDAPLANAQSVSTNEDTPKGITLTGSDVEGSTLSYEVTSAPVNGSLTISGSAVTYTPAANYYGSDSFTFRVNDGSLNSTPATVSISVIPLNDAPIAADQNLNTNEDTQLAIVLTAVDVDNSLSYSITQSPVNGTLSGSGTNVTYTPNLNFSGSDSFRFTATDGSLTSNEAVVTITVTPVNDAPVANPQNVSTNENAAKAITLTGSDVEADPLAFALGTAPTHGSIILSGAVVTYTPSTGYSGPDNFTFTVNDGQANSAPATVSIQVISLGSPPTATNKNVSTNEDTPVDVDLTPLVTDSDGHPITHSVTVQPQHGVVVLNGPIVTYTPNVNYFGNDTISFVGNDGIYNSNTAKIFLTVLVVNDAPTANNQSVTTAEEVPVVVNLTGSDPDGSTLNYLVVTAPANGTLSGTGSSLTYTPKPNFNGADNFTFKANDGFTDSNIATISITVTPVNDAPTITALTSLPATKEDSLLRVCLDVVDVDGDAVVFNDPVSIKSGGYMTRDLAPFDFCYIFYPEPNYNGESIWNMLVTDNKGSSGSAPARILILPVNDASVASNDFATVNANSILTYNIVQNDLPIESPYQEFYDIYQDDSTDVVKISTILSGPYNGTVTVADDKESIQYKPGSFTFIGSDSIRYQICDSGYPSLCATAVLFIDVTDNVFPFTIYDGVSPNNDGLNDYLHIDGIHRHTKNLVRIFDRYNNLVWEMSDYDNEGRRWSGQSNNGLTQNRLADGTYYYTIYLNDNKKLYSGYVVLKEN
jgi:gliding motility-associated-like protein